MKVDDEVSLDKNMTIFAQSEASEKPILMEVFTNKNKDARILKEFYHSLKNK